jgi:hypothetical protein
MRLTAATPSRGGGTHHPSRGRRRRRVRAPRVFEATDPVPRGTPSVTSRRQAAVSATADGLAEGETRFRFSLGRAQLTDEHDFVICGPIHPSIRCNAINRLPSAEAAL